MSKPQVDRTWALWAPTNKTTARRIVRILNWEKGKHNVEVLIDGQTKADVLAVELYPMLGLIPGDLGPCS